MDQVIFDKVEKRVRPHVNRIVQELFNTAGVSYSSDDYPYDNVVFTYRGNRFPIYKGLFFRISGKSTVVIDDKDFYDAQKYMILNNFGLTKYMK